jgi:hypothetical protein
MAARPESKDLAYPTRSDNRCLAERQRLDTGQSWWVLCQHAQHLCPGRCLCAVSIRDFAYTKYFWCLVVMSKSDIVLSNK